MKGNRRLAGAGCQGQQDAGLVFGEGLQGIVDRDFLIIARRLCAADVFKGHRVEFVFPGIRRWESPAPQFIGRGELPDQPLFAGVHFDLVDFLAVGSEGKVQLELLSVILGLAHAFAHHVFVALGFNDRHLPVFIKQDVIGDERFVAPTGADLAGGDMPFAQDFGTRQHAPAAGAQLGVDQFGSGFSFIHQGTLCGYLPGRG